MAAQKTLEQTDGRRARSARTRTLIVEALMALIEEGHLRPTSEDVAQRAAVGHRTVFRHFQDMDTLYQEIQRRLQETVIDAVQPVERKGPLDARISAIVDLRTDVFERIKMFRRSTEVRRWESEFLMAARAHYIKRLRKSLFHTLPELNNKPAPIQYAAELLLSFESWEQLRADKKMSLSRARDVLKASLAELLS